MLENAGISKGALSVHKAVAQTITLLESSKEDRIMTVSAPEAVLA